MEITMKEKTREQQVLDILKDHGHTSVHTLCQTLYLSEATVRRCLVGLAHKGLIRRTHGGAELLDNFTHVSPFRSRIQLNAASKQDIAEKAAALIPDGSILFLDQSSTCYHLAEKLIEKKGLTVVTNNLEIASYLGQTDFQVFLSGGQLCHGTRMCLVGTNAQQTFNQFHGDFVFFSTRSLSDNGVISDCNHEEIHIRNAMLQNAARRVFLCDSSKFSTTSGHIQCSLKNVDVLISEGDSAQRYSKDFPQLQTL